MTVGRHRAGGDHHHRRRSNDAAVITGDTTGSVVGAGGVANGTPGTSFVVGDLDAADVDNTSDSWTAIETPTLSANGYGTFTIDAAGLWVYILDNDNAAVQALNVGDTLTDTFTATTVDGTTQLVTITINGSQRCRGDHRPRDRHGGGGRRRQQWHAGHADRDRRSQFHRCRQPERRLDGGSGRRPPAPTATAPTR